jgi:polyisoprenyl-teichoic acid--peptidoglycan teichoic acid transferase
MNQYKSPQSKKPNSIDGFLVTGPRKPVKPTNYFGDKPQTPFRTTLNDFNKTEGFHRQTSNPIKEGGSYRETNSTPSLGEQFERSNVKIANQSVSRNTVNLNNVSLRNHNKRKNNRKSKKRIILRTFMLSAVAVLLVFGAFFGKAWWDTQKVLSGGGGALALSKDLDPNTLNGEGDGRVNILLMGKGGDTHAGGQLTDTIMIASLDPINNGVVLLSIPRDLWVDPDGLWPMKINAVYNSAKEQAAYRNNADDTAAEKAGIAAIEKVVEDYMGVNINYYGMVDFTAFEEVVNIMGGITVNLEEPYSDPTMRIGKKVLDLPAGPNQLDGGTALGLARSRYGAERGDFDRGQNQQAVILGIKDKALTLGTMANPLKISQLVSSFGNRVQTNFSVDDMLRLYELSKNIPNQNITNVDLAMKGEAVVKTGNIGGQSVVVPVAGLEDFSEVKKFVRLKLKDSFIIKEDPTIIVLNASGKSGAATKRAEELKSYGYNVIQVADAPISDVSITQLVDNTKGAKKYTKRYLELRLRTNAVDNVDGIDLSPYLADYIIVIGQNG